MLNYEALWSASYYTVGLVANVTNHCFTHRHSMAQPFQVLEGSEPNEHGTWQYGRGGWCDGQEVNQHTDLLLLHPCILQSIYVEEGLRPIPEPPLCVKRYADLSDCIIIVILHICNTNMSLHLPSCCYISA